MLVRLSEWPSTPLDQMRRDLARTFGLEEDDFYTGGPLMIVEDEDRQYMPVQDGSSLWLNLNLWMSYFGEDYQRGDIALFVRCAEWLEKTMPGSEVFYGHDADDRSISLFDKPTRQRLLNAAA